MCDCCLTQEEQLGEWRLKRDIDDKDKVEFGLPKAFVLKAGEKIKVQNAAPYFEKFTGKCIKSASPVR